MEPIIMPKNIKVKNTDKSWALTGANGRKPKIIRSLYLKEGALEQLNEKIALKLKRMEEREVRYEEYMVDDADLILVAYGTVARICRSAVNRLRDEKIRAGLFRPITLWPYPYQQLFDATGTAKAFLDVEMNMGQMIDDVKLAVRGSRPVHFYGRSGGMVMTVDDVVEKAREALAKVN